MLGGCRKDHEVRKGTWQLPEPPASHASCRSAVSEGPAQRAAHKNPVREGEQGRRLKPTLTLSDFISASV